MARVHPTEEINANNTRNPFRDSVLECLGEDGCDGAGVESHRAV
jgi:hypothetical protein